MPDHPETSLERARRHVAICQSLIAERRSHIKRLRVERRSTEQSESALATLEDTLKKLREQLELLRSSDEQ